MEKFAKISECEKYRYMLLRRWGIKDGLVVWIMLNPSTADANVDDPTIRRCMKFTERFGYEEMAVVNLYAFRTPNPRKLRDQADPVGPRNYQWVRDACEDGALLIAAWGALKEPPDYMKPIFEMLDQRGHTLKCLGTTKNGSPRHPLYLKGDARLIPWHAPNNDGGG